MIRIVTFFFTLSCLSYGQSPAPAAEPVKLLFLGDTGHHQPAARFAQLAPVMKERGIELTYSDKVEDLKPATLGKYDGLVIYANTTRISPEQEQALLDYVAGGKGFIPLHCASYCFLNSPKYIELVGAQFQRHGTGTFRTILAETEHPILRGFGGFESWDETYVHTKHNEDRTVLEYRQEGDRREPWTWVRAHVKGRVFYTAWGHDQRTWGNPGFHNLVERGIRWAVGADPGVVPAFVATPTRRASGGEKIASAFAAAEPQAPQMTPKRTDGRPFEYTEANIPFYPPGQRWGTVTTGPRQMQLPLTVEESMKHFVTPVGFEVKLFVSEPQLEGKPIYMTWDERGRLWVCETYDYPNELQPIGDGRDRIRICEDTDGDGRADKFAVFAEKLSIPTTIAFYRGGAIVQNGTETIYLKDTDGDDRADLRKTLVTGWNMRDTHGEVSNFRYGLDNWYYAMQGYNDSQPVLTDGTRGPRFRQGFFRFKVEGENENVAVTQLEFLRSTNNNTWGLGISEEGIIFGSTANGNPSEHMPIPNRYYEAVRGWSSTGLTGIADSNRFYPITDKVRQVDWHGGFTAAAGHALYTARNYPREFWNRTAFVCEPTGHLIATFVLRQEGAGFKSKNSWNLVASDDEWTSPIQAEVGPDGNVWFIDWYNYIVQHNPTPAGFQTGKGAAYETPLRDKKHGRVYRLVYVGGRGQETGNQGQEKRLRAGEASGPRELVALLKSANMHQRLLGQRLLVERGQKDVVAELVALLADSSVDAIGLNPGAIHALGTLAGLDGLQPEQLAAGLKHPAAGVRRVAAQLVPAGNPALDVLLSSGALNDADVQVRLQAILALARFQPTERAAAVVVRAFADPAVQGDKILLDAATAAAAEQEHLFLTAVCQSSDKALAAPAATERLAIVAEHVARGELADPRPILTALESAQPEIASAVLRGLARGWPRDRRPELSPALEQSLAGLFDKVSPAGKSQVAALATRWGSHKLGEQIAAMAAAFYDMAAKNDAPDAERLAAAVQFVELHKSDSAAAKLLDLITPRSSPELARGVVEALGRSEALAIGVALADQLPRLTPAVRQTALRVLLSRNDWTGSLLGAIQQGKVQLADLSLDQKQALASHPDRQIAGRARRLLEASGSLPNPDRQKVLEELLPLVEQKGDPAAGKVVFKNQCAKCHTHSGEGTRIGPDLTGMAVHPKHELLVHLIDPSRSVEGNFRVFSVLTTEGQTINGLLASETKTAIELVDTEAKRHIVLREDIEQLQASPKSLMPEGFEKQVKTEEIRDLLEFLTQRGRYVPIPLEKVATVVSTKGMFFDENSRTERLVFDDWSPKTIEGVPFVLVDPQGDKLPNAVLLYGPQGKIPPTMPRSVALPCSFPAKAVHLLSGVSGWGFPGGQHGSTSLIVRLHYADGQTEDHRLANGEHFADYIRRVDVPLSKFAFNLRGRQLRYLSVPVEREEPLAKIELVKGDDRTAPIVMAVTVESR